VKNIMVRQVETIAPDASLQLAARRMVSSQLSDLVVVQDNVPVGVLTTRDILKVLVR
jgi:acetoin utilization protein AcuB